MRFSPNPIDRLRLETASRSHERADVRRRAAWLLAIARGTPIARLARAVKVSRPTVYKVLRAWARTHSVEALRTDIASRIGGKRPPEREGGTDERNATHIIERTRPPGPIVSKGGHAPREAPRRGRRSFQGPPALVVSPPPPKGEAMPIRVIKDNVGSPARLYGKNDGSWVSLEADATDYPDMHSACGDCIKAKEAAEGQELVYVKLADGSTVFPALRRG